MDSLPERRSSRVRKTVQRFEDDEEYQTPVRPEQRSTIDRTKRKAAVAGAAATAAHNTTLENAGPLLEDILSKMTPDERKEYQGWVELESEPVCKSLSFFPFLDLFFSHLPR